MVQCGYYRPLSSYSSGFYTALKSGETVKFKAGFNVFSSAVDGAPDARDYGDFIAIVLLDSSLAKTLESIAAIIVLLAVT